MIRCGSTLAYEALKNLTLVAKDRLPKIDRMVFEITDACNSRCRHCNIWKTKPTGDILTLEEIKKFFSDELLKNLDYVIITGGECFLRNDLEEIILSINEVQPGIRMTLSTNGLLPERIIEVVTTALKNNIHFDVGISLDGIGEEHDMIRGVQGNYERIDFLMHELTSLKGKHNGAFSVTIAHTLSELTADSLMAVATYAYERKLDFLTQMCEEFSYYNNVDKLNTSNNTIKQIKALEQLPASFHNEILLKALKMNKPIHFNCYSMKTFFLLRCNGDIVPCLRYSSYKVGNIRDNSFSEIWRSITAQGARNFVNNCEGCSNTWATSWSYSKWFPSFLDVLIRYKVKKEIGRFRKNGLSKS